VGLERVFDILSKYHMKFFLGDFNAKVGKEGTFKPTTGNQIYMKLDISVELQ
jgi:hypothetical protein